MGSQAVSQNTPSTHPPHLPPPFLSPSGWDCHRRAEMPRETESEGVRGRKARRNFGLIKREGREVEKNITNQQKGGGGGGEEEGTLQLSLLFPAVLQQSASL